jgi:integrase/recombinase XerC
MFKHNLTACINKQRPDRFGNVAVRIRATIKRKVTYYPTGVMIPLKCWEEKSRTVVKHDNKNQLNLIVSKRIAELERELIAQDLSGNTALKVVPAKTVIFSTYADMKINQARSKESIGTIKHKESYLNKFNSFRSKVKLSEVTPALLYEYENYCRGLGNTDNTIWSSLKFITTIINAACREGVVSKNPMLGFKRTKYQNPERIWLTAEELNQIEAFAKRTKNVQYRDAANWFLFCCYSGLRFGDLKAFTPNKVVNGKIILRTEKSGTDVAIKMHTRLKAVYDRMNFDVVSNVDYNRKLKAVAESAEIDKKLTSHTARHTFAVQHLNQGGSMELLSKILGHSTLKTTSIYGKITDVRIDDEMDRVWK